MLPSLRDLASGADAAALGGAARPPVRLATWVVVYALFLSQDWVTNWLRPTEMAYDVFERGDWTASHVLANLVINALVGAYATALVLWRRFRPLHPLWQSRSIVLLVLYVMTTLISSIYSPIWSLSLVSAGKWLAAIALVAVYAEGLHPIHCWRPAITVTLFVLVGGQVGAIVLEFLTSGTLGLGGAEVHRLTGIEHPVRLGLIGALSLLMGGVWVFGGDPVVPALRVLFRWAVGGLGILIIALTVSRTGLFVLMIAGLTILVVARRRLSLILAVVYPMLIVLPLFGLILGVEAVEGLVERYVFRYSREETFTLTGRFEVWAEAADLIAGRPLTGYGFVAGPRLELARRVASWRPMHAHNAWLQAGLDVGLVGASAFALSAVGFLGLALRGVRSPPGQNARGRICGCQLLGAVVVVALAIASVSEPVFASGASGLGTLWLVGGTVLAVGRSCRPTSASKAASPCGSF